MLDRDHHQAGRWARRLECSCVIAAGLAFSVAAWLPRDHAARPTDDAPTVPAIHRVMPLAPDAAFLPPIARVAPAFEAALGGMAAPLAVALQPGRAMSPEDFRRLYEGDPGDYATLVFAAR